MVLGLEPATCGTFSGRCTRAALGYRRYDSIVGPVTAVAIAVFVVAYVLIASERVHKTTAALSGAGIVLAVVVGRIEQDIRCR